MDIEHCVSAIIEKIKEKNCNNISECWYTFYKGPEWRVGNDLKIKYNNFTKDHCEW
jgi:hypothetical protein